jgi:hypothetical protein
MLHIIYCYLNFLSKIYYYSEVWMLLIPIALFYIKKEQPAYMKPIKIYVWVALFLSSLCYSVDIFFEALPKNLRSNTIIYNLHSLGRFLLFSWFFIQVKPQYFKRINIFIIGLFLTIFLIYFSFFDNFFNKNYISGDMMSGESFFLLCLSMVYYLTILRSENPRFTNRKDFWVVTGLAIFCAINFFIFLFYMPLLTESIKVAINIWEIYIVAFNIFIIFLSIAIYVPDTNNR